MAPFGRAPLTFEVRRGQVITHESQIEVREIGQPFVQVRSEGRGVPIGFRTGALIVGLLVHRDHASCPSASPRGEGREQRTGLGRVEVAVRARGPGVQRAVGLTCQWMSRRLNVATAVVTAQTVTANMSAVRP